MAGTPQVVADASVIIKWFIDEENTDMAALLKDDYQKRIVYITVPDLLPYEVLNVLRYKPSIGENDLHEVAKDLDGFQLNKVSLETDYCKKTVSLSLKDGITVYDAAYACLAGIRRCWLLTADEKLARKLVDKERVLLLKNYARFRKKLLEELENSA